MKTKAHIILILATLTLAACTPTADDPKTVADKYWNHLQSGNLEEARKLALPGNQQALQLHSNHIISNSQFHNEEAKTIVSTTITTINPSTGYKHTQHFDTVLVLHDGHWLIDAAQTRVPPPPSAREEEMRRLAEELSESMHDNIESIDDAVTEGMEMLNEALQEGSKEMGESLLQLMNELNQTMSDSIERMKERRQQQMQQAPQQQNGPDPAKGEGMI